MKFIIMFVAALYCTAAFLTGCSKPTVTKSEKSKEDIPEDVDVLDFIDNTPSYKGKKLRMELHLKRMSHVELMDKGLRELRGPIDLPFYSYEGGASLNMNILVDKDIEVPNAQQGDAVLITFICGDGSLKHGNLALKVTRP